MSKWKVTFITYEDYDVEANTEDEALDIAEKELNRDRSIPVASCWYDDMKIECLDDE